MLFVEPVRRRHAREVGAYLRVSRVTPVHLVEALLTFVEVRRLPDDPRLERAKEHAIALREERAVLERLRVRGARFGRRGLEREVRQAPPGSGDLRILLDDSLQARVERTDAVTEALHRSA